MYIKRYTIATAILIALVGWYVYAYITQDTISIDFFGITLPSLSISLWVIVPLIVLYLATVLHMAFYSMINSFQLRKYEKDSEKLLDSIVEAFLNKENRNHSFKTLRYQLLGSIVDNTTIFPHQGITKITKNDKINDVMNAIEAIKEGKTADLKSYSLEPNNDLVLQNNRNRYKSGEITADEILSHSANYAETLCKEAYVQYVQTASLHNIEKYKSFMTKDSLNEILARVNGNQHRMEIPNETIISFLDDSEMNEEEYVEISASLSTGMIPEQRIKLFEIISEKNDKAMKAYLFTLFDLEMVDVAKNLIEHTHKDEHMKFKAYLALKECNKNFNINLFL